MIAAYDQFGNLIQHPCGNLLSSSFDSLISNPLALDLLNIFAAAYLSDITVEKENAEEGRLINFTAIVAGVNEPFWNEKKQQIERLLNFVTEGDLDSWEVNFNQVNYTLTNHQCTLFGDNYDYYSNISLLSGGLDSFCGIHHNNAQSESAIYCAYKTSTLGTGKINAVFNFAHSEDPRSILFAFEKFDVKKLTSTQRTRSLLFFSLACCSAVLVHARNIRIFENGIMSLNPSFETRGTTRTTHPNTIYQFQQLINDMKIGLTFSHPFLFKTKGEMIIELPEHHRNIIKQTRSCSSSLQKIKYRAPGLHSCGVCVPCLLRKISLSAYDLESLDHDYFIPYQGSDDDTEYTSSYSYFLRFANAIDNGTILGQLGMRKRFYSEDDYFEQTDRMLKTFRSELEVFFKKYGR